MTDYKPATEEEMEKWEQDALGSLWIAESVWKVRILSLIATVRALHINPL